MEASESSNKAVGPVIAISLVILSFLFWLIYFQNPIETDANWVAILPNLIASFNALAACCLAVGLIAIKRGKRVLHISMMISATVSSALFLVTYIIKHTYSGDTLFQGEGFIKLVYLILLASHIILSMVVVPLILLTLWFAIRKYYDKHKKIARWTFPIWMYVSVTGILVYLILQFYQPV